MTATVLIVLVALTSTLLAFLVWCVYAALRLRGQSRAEAATRVAVAVLIQTTGD